MDLGKIQNVDREQAASNAMTTLQARYGEKPKEARAIKKALDKDDFMKIMITEMKHQDPTKPMDSDKMATQMAQITSVEQMKNVGQAVEKLADKNSASDRLAMSAMIGKSVTVDKGRFSHQKGTLSPINFDLPQDANKIKISILDERGDVIATRDLEPMKKGPNVYSWDGMNASGISVPSSTYTVRVDAENAQGGKIKIEPISRESIVGVSFEGGDTNFLVGDPKNPQKVSFKNLIRIDGDALPSKHIPTAANIPQKENGAKDVRAEGAEVADAEPAAVAPNAPFGLPQELKEKLIAEQQAGAVKAEGFPNGLRD